jgi:adenine-specific DNA-methyltransferase
VRSDPSPRGQASHRQPDARRGPRPGKRPPLRVFTTTLWEYPSQHYDSRTTPGKGVGDRTQTTMQGDKDYAGATPSWVIWQVLTRYTRENDTVLDPMCGSGTTLDVCADLNRKGLGFDLAPSRADIRQADARKLPLPDASIDFVFVDPPYSTHIDYSDDPRCIGKLDAAPDSQDHGRAYYAAMKQVIAETHRVLKPRRYMALYVSDSWRKRRGTPGEGAGVFMPIGFELFAIMQRTGFKPIDIIAVVRHNQKLARGNWHKAAEEGNFFLRGFNYLFIMKKP